MTTTPLALLPSYSLEKWKVNKLALSANTVQGLLCLKLLPSHHCV